MVEWTKAFMKNGFYTSSLTVGQLYCALWHLAFPSLKAEISCKYGSVSLNLTKYDISNHLKQSEPAKWRFFSKICHFASHKKHLFWLANFWIFQNLALICPYFFWYRLELLLHCFIYLTEGNSVILVPNWKDSFKKLEKFHEKLLSPLDFK